MGASSEMVRAGARAAFSPLRCRAAKISAFSTSRNPSIPAVEKSPSFLAVASVAVGSGLSAVMGAP